LLGLFTSLRVGESLVVLVEGRHQLRQERSDDLRILDKLTHVVDDDSRLTLDGSLTLSKTTLKKRDHDGQGRLMDISDESGGTEQVNSLGDVLRLGNTLDELRNETLNILVDDQATDLLHGTVGSLLDLGLGVPHGLGDNGDEVWNEESKLGGGGLDEGFNALKTGHFLGPFLGRENRFDDGRKSSLGGVGINGLDERDSSHLGSVLDVGHLVTNSIEGRAQKSDQVRLDTGSNGRVLSDGTDGLDGTLTSVGILLVGKLLLEGLDSLEGDGLLFDGAVQKSGEIVGVGVGLIGGLGDGQVLDQTLDDSDGVGGLLARDGGNGRNINSRHFGVGRRGENRERGNIRGKEAENTKTDL